MLDRLEKVLVNPTLHPNSLAEDELPGEFKWHKYASSPRSSQVLCVSAFGTLRRLKLRDKIIDHFLSANMPAYRRGRRAPRWRFGLEREEPELLNECGGRRKQPTSIDVLLASSKGTFAIEANFVADARAGFSECSQFGNGSCAGFYGPGSDARTQSQAWYRLETWENDRSPRAYWALGRENFRPTVFAMQKSGDVCPLRGSNLPVDEKLPVWRDIRSQVWPGSTRDDYDCAGGHIYSPMVTGVSHRTSLMSGLLDA